MITETLQAVILSTYCAIIFFAIAHAITCGILFVCIPLESNQLLNPPFQSPESPSLVIPEPINTDIQAHLGIRELKTMASKHKIRGYGKMSKSQLIQALSKNSAVAEIPVADLEHIGTPAE